MKTKDEAKTEYWQHHIAEQLNSSLSITEYCKQNEISRDTFYRWRKLLSEGSPRRRVSPVKARVSSFIPVQVESLQSFPRRPSRDILSDPKFLGEFVASFLRGLA